MCFIHNIGHRMVLWCWTMGHSTQDIWKTSGLHSVPISSAERALHLIQQKGRLSSALPSISSLLYRCLVLSFVLPFHTCGCKKHINLHTLDTKCRERSRGNCGCCICCFGKNRLTFVGKNTIITLILKRVLSCHHGNQQLPLSDFCHSFWSACFGPECGQLRDGVPVLVKSGRATICPCLWWTWGSACVMCICGEWESSPPSQLDSILITSWKDTFTQIFLLCFWIWGRFMKYLESLNKITPLVSGAGCHFPTFPYDIYICPVYPVIMSYVCRSLTRLHVIAALSHFRVEGCIQGAVTPTMSL